jgi:hypothetical protein
MPFIVVVDEMTAFTLGIRSGSGKPRAVANTPRRRVDAKG